MRVAIIGAGNVGRTLGRLFRGNGLCEIGDILNRSRRSAEEAADFIGGGRPIADIGELTSADVWMMSVSDPAIHPMAVELAQIAAASSGTIAFHCSGSIPSSALDPLAAKGVHICSIHPVKSFADPQTSLETFRGTFCGAEGDGCAVAVAGAMFEGCGAKVFRLKTEEKEIYHAASVFVCNYVTALLDVGLKCFERAGVDRAMALDVMGPLVMETVRNNLEQGPEASLTGPIARGDHVLVREHISKLEEWDADIAALYRELAKPALDISRRKGAADAKGLEAIKTLLT